MRSKMNTEIADLGDLGLDDLRQAWRKRLGGTPPVVSSAELLRRCLGWEIQARAQGGLDSDTRRRLRELGRTFDKASVPPSARASNDQATGRGLPPGTRLQREHAGTTHRVMVLEKGFAWNGQIFSSLSEVAYRITGTRWSGPRFFGLKQMRVP
jgi:Protein of unknown function (DUF2924)